jgi:methyltransferase family protein
LWPQAVTKGPVRFVTYLAFRDPRLLLDYVRWFVGSRRKSPAELPFRPDAVAISPQQARDLIFDSLAPPAEGPALREARLEAPRATRMDANLTTMAGDASLGELLYVLVRGLRPELVVETGVAQGITSAYILAGLSDNGIGQLHSIDLPSRGMITSGLVGAAVSNGLRKRWTYHWGPSSRLLPPLLERSGRTLSLFVHDSDHRYANMRRELEWAWKSAGEDAWIVADDVELHSAFQDFAATAGGEPVYVSQEAKRGWTGLLRKRRNREAQSP